MEFGIGIATSSDSWRLAQRAEELGFTHAWFYDTQMITADPFVAMGAAATRTDRIRLGTEGIHHDRDRHPSARGRDQRVPHLRPACIAVEDVEGEAQA